MIFQGCKVSISQLFIEILKFFTEDIDLMIKILKTSLTILNIDEEFNTLGIYNEINFNIEEFGLYGFQKIFDEYKYSENKKFSMIVKLLRDRIYS